MFCRKCGEENNDEAKFCKNCGEDLSGTNVEKGTRKGSKEKDNTIKYSLKPTYNWGYKSITVGLGSLVVALIIIFYLFEEYTFDILLSGSPIGLIVFIGIVIFIIVRMVMEKFQYNKLEYNFYNDRIEYVDGFFNISQKELKYKYVREVTMTRNILERLFDIGTIRIYTNASSGYKAYGRNRANRQGENGITIHCITNTKEQYEKVKAIIDVGDEGSED